MIYTGEILKGKPHGNGSAIKNNCVFVGKWHNGKMNGIGKIVVQKYSYYIGGIKNNKMHGIGKITYLNDYIICEKGEVLKNEIFSMEGNWICDVLNGKSVIIYRDGSKYIGNVCNFLKKGPGILYKHNGRIIEGTWDENHLVGNCNVIFEDRYVVCKVTEHQISFPVSIFYKNGDSYIGYCNSDFLPDGPGYMKYICGSFYRGNFCGGNFDGYGFLKFSNGDYYNGSWKNNVRDGIGVYYFKQHSNAKAYKFENDKPVTEYGDYYY